MLQEMNIGVSVRAGRVLAVGTLLAALAVSSSPANAAIIGWDFAKGVEYTQTANNTPPASTGTFATSSISTANIGDILAANLSRPTSLADPYLQVGTQWTVDINRLTLVALDLVFPQNVVYSMNITGGPLMPLSQTFNPGFDNFPTSAPFLTGNSFNDLKGLDPANIIPLSWNSPGSANAGSLTLNIFHLPLVGLETLIFTHNVGSAVTGFDLPGGTLIPGEKYSIELSYINATLPAADPTGFNVPGRVAFEKITAAVFQTIPTPGTAAILGIGGLVSLRRRRV